MERTWYEDWFDRDEYDIVYQHRDEEEAGYLIDLIERETRPPKGATILDIGCGRGRHAIDLAKRGYEVTGIDIAPRAIERAREAARTENVEVNFHVDDMREPQCRSCFDGVVNLFTAFGYFDDETDHLRSVKAFAQSLRPGGWLVQDFLNAAFVRDNLVARDQRSEDGLVITQTRWIEDGRVNKRIDLSKDGETRSFEESVRLLELSDFQRMYHVAGVALSQTFGDYHGGPYTPDSPRLIMFGYKS